MKTFWYDLYYDSDVDRFRELVKENGGKVIGVISFPLVCKPVSFLEKKRIIYQCDRELEMEVLP